MSEMHRNMIKTINVFFDDHKRVFDAKTEFKVSV